MVICGWALATASRFSPQGNVKLTLTSNKTKISLFGCAFLHATRGYTTLQISCALRGSAPPAQKSSAPWRGGAPHARMASRQQAARTTPATHKLILSTCRVTWWGAASVSPVGQVTGRVRARCGRRGRGHGARRCRQKRQRGPRFDPPPREANQGVVRPKPTRVPSPLQRGWIHSGRAEAAGVAGGGRGCHLGRPRALLDGLIAQSLERLHEPTRLRSSLSSRERPPQSRR